MHDSLGSSSGCYCVLFKGDTKSFVNKSSNICGFGFSPSASLLFFFSPLGGVGEMMPQHCMIYYSFLRKRLFALSSGISDRNRTGSSHLIRTLRRVITCRLSIQWSPKVFPNFSGWSGSPSPVATFVWQRSPGPSGVCLETDLNSGGSSEDTAGTAGRR